MKPALILFVLCVTLFSCHKPGKGSTTVTTLPLLNATCPSSATGAYGNCIMWGPWGGRFTATISADSATGTYIFQKQVGHLSQTFYATIQCDSNYIDIPEQESSYNIMGKIRGQGRIYEHIIVLNYSLYDPVEYYRWYGGTDTLAR